MYGPRHLYNKYMWLAIQRIHMTNNKDEGEKGTHSVTLFPEVERITTEVVDVVSDRLSAVYRKWPTYLYVIENWEYC